VIDKQHIIEEIRRTAEENGGKPLGQGRFEQETDIRPGDWLGRHWARWSDAVRDAGLEPNQMQQGFDETMLLEWFIPEVRRHGRLPTSNELRLRKRTNDGFPSVAVFKRRWKTQRSMAARLVAYCEGKPELADVMGIASEIATQPERPTALPSKRTADVSFVYLLKLGRKYKIGRSNAFGRRERELAIQMPERASTVHIIKTDDPVGIERYWHQRFAEQRTRPDAEWFELTADDVSAFKRRKFM
jgi:hypothetical protein